MRGGWVMGAGVVGLYMKGVLCSLLGWLAVSRIYHIFQTIRRT